MTLDPQREELLKLVEHKNGNLFWLPRGVARIDKQFAGKKAGCVRPDGYVCIAWQGRHVLAHRVIWILENGAIPADKFIDHINQNRSDNRIQNLRLCCVSQNNCNAKLRKDSTSKVKGVCWDTQRNKWRARVKYRGQQYHAGFYSDLTDAAIAVQKKRQEVHNEFAAHQSQLVEAVL